MTYKVAVVDDDVSMLMAVRGILSENDMSVVPLKSGKALLEYIEVQTPDIILLDIVMPEMDGFETYSALRAKEKELQKKETPVIFLTAKDDREEETKGAGAGGNGLHKKAVCAKGFASKSHSFDRACEASK